MHEFIERVGATASVTKHEAARWASGRSALARAPLYAYLVYAGVRHILDPLYRSWFAGITLAFHEMGHIVFSPFGHTLHILGGTIMQLLVPFAAGAYLWMRQRDYWGAAVGSAWLSFSMWEMATYMADANKMRLPLVGFGENPGHDWSMLFTQWRVLNACDSIATTARAGATLVWLGSLAWAGWLMWVMWRDQHKT